MSAREVIATRVGKLMGWHGPLATSEADAFIAALTAAGYSIAPPGSRVVPEGGVDAAIEALKPFADEAQYYDPPEGDDGETAFLRRFLIGDLRKARAALRALAETKP